MSHFLQVVKLSGLRCAHDKTIVKHRMTHGDPQTQIIHIVSLLVDYGFLLYHLRQESPGQGGMTLFLQYESEEMVESSSVDSTSIT